jgi:hypothetical protein
MSDNFDSKFRPKTAPNRYDERSLLRPRLVAARKGCRSESDLWRALNRRVILTQERTALLWARFENCHSHNRFWLPTEQEVFEAWSARFLLLVAAGLHHMRRWWAAAKPPDYWGVAPFTLRLLPQAADDGEGNPLPTPP